MMSRLLTTPSQWKTAPLSLALALLSALISVTARADSLAAASKYAVLSLIGDSMTIVTYAKAAGSHIDQNQHQSIPLADPAFDHAAATAIEDALRRISPQVPVVLLSTSSPALFNDQQKLFDGSRVVLTDVLGDSLRSAGATHLVLVTKHRAETRVGARSGGSGSMSLGSGYLEGLGFYIDRQLSTKRGDSGERGRGFLAPYVYVKISLIDLASSTMAREEVVTASRMISAARSADGDPWGAMTATQKAEVLRRLIDGEMHRAIPLLIASQKP